MSDQDMLLTQALHEYYEVRSARYAPGTWRNIEWRLEQLRVALIKAYDGDPMLNEIEDRSLYRIFNRHRAAYAAGTFNNYRQYAKMFFDFCRQEGWLRTNPMRHVEPEKQPTRRRLQLTPAEMQSAIDNADEPRDRIGLAIGINTGLRAQDVTGLTVGNVMLDVGFIQAWIQKTKVEEMLPVPTELREEVIRWFKHYATVMGVNDWRELPNNWYLVPPMRHHLAKDPTNPGASRNIYVPRSRLSQPEKIVHRALVKLGHPTDMEGFHTLRRSAARAVFNIAEHEDDLNTSAIRVAQALLGHKSQATTERYLGLTHDQHARDTLLRGRSFLTAAVELDRSLTGDEGTTGQIRAVGG